MPAAAARGRPARTRITRTDTVATGGGTSTTITVSLGNVEHVIAADGSGSYRRYLAGGSVLVTRNHDTLNTQTGADTRYLLHDHLGSVVRVLDRHGVPVQSFGYDAWGQRRHPDTAAVLVRIPVESERGFRFKVNTDSG